MVDFRKHFNLLILLLKIGVVLLLIPFAYNILGFLLGNFSDPFFPASIDGFLNIMSTIMLFFLSLALIFGVYLALFQKIVLKNLNFLLIFDNK